ncbi:sensor histidine kinase [Longirhabdus pacifica]|uniref:sensor histidine kinase n=1 Tax=Longirhabdus pacifica TaxID=2305227 RepID=UPI0013E8ABBE|nr:HAMP domain-containing sensor histidine kinase [Longirhabdus pacifica]
MMVIGSTVIIIVLLLATNIFQYTKIRTRKTALQHINKQLEKINEQGQHGHVGYITRDPDVKTLLTHMNNMIHRKQRLEIENMETQQSMKKMLSNISHDLKTPLTVILGYTEMMKVNHDEEKQRKWLDKVILKTNEVIQQIHRFFDLAKLESGDEVMTFEHIHLNEICRTNMLSFYALFTDHGFEVDIQIPETPIYVVANEEGMHRVLNNVLANVIKYGKDGKYVGLQLRYDTDFAYIDIIDKGKGVEEKTRIFERLYTENEARQGASSGLGLAITKQLVQAMDGKIEVESQPFKKTIFSITLNRK